MHMRHMYISIIMVLLTVISRIVTQSPFLQVWLNYKKAFIGFWKDNTMNGLGKFIINGKKKYGVYQEGKLMEKINKKDFFKRIKEQNTREQPPEKEKET